MTITTVYNLNDFLIFLDILDTNLLMLTNVFYSEDILWKVRAKY